MFLKELIINLKYLLALVLPWASFYIIENTYGSSDMFSHHPCTVTYLGCLKYDFISYFLKGVLCSLFLVVLLEGRKFLYVSILSGLVLMILVGFRSYGLYSWKYINWVIADYYYWLSHLLPFILGILFGYVIFSKIKRVITSHSNGRRGAPPIS